MGLNQFFQAFQPKDKIFYKLFEDISNNLIEMASYFHESMKAKQRINDDFIATIKAYEHKNDELTHQTYNALSEVFITPFDREDISALVSNLDDIADYMNASAEYLVLYETPYETVYQEFSRLIVKCCEELRECIDGLHGFKDISKVKEKCIVINSLENEADKLLSNSMVELFKTNDAIRIIKTQTVYRHLEEVTDRAETVANILQNVVIKYS